MNLEFDDSELELIIDILDEAYDFCSKQFINMGKDREALSKKCDHIDVLFKQALRKRDNLRLKNDLQEDIDD